MVRRVFYVAGPMSGVPQMNFPAFDGATAHLRELGHKVISPAELDNPAARARALASPDGRMDPNGQTWGDFLARDVRIVADEATDIALLPGWEHSRGAVLEVAVATLCRHQLWLYWRKGPVTLEHLPHWWAASAVHEKLLRREQ